MPGLFTASASQSALPVDRVFFEYGYFNGVAVRGVGSSAPMLSRATITTPGPPKIIPNSEGPPTIIPTFKTSVHTLGVTQSPDPVAGFNLHSFKIGVEKTFLDGLASAYVAVPFLNATDNITGQPINGLGDINAGFKVILYQSLPTGNTLTGGFTISFPTAHAAVSNGYVQSNDGTGDTLLPSSQVRINPTFLQPWVAGLFIFDRLFIHEYLAIMFPTDERISPFLTSDLSVGYSLYRAGEGQWFSSVTPTLAITAFIPLSNRGTPSGLGATVFVPPAGAALPPPPPASLFSYNDQVFVSGGVQLGLLERWLFSANVVVPVAGPRGYTVGATFGLNYFY
jgi:hypothetical protein